MILLFLVILFMTSTCKTSNSSPGYDYILRPVGKLQPGERAVTKYADMFGTKPLCPAPGMTWVQVPRKTPDAAPAKVFAAPVTPPSSSSSTPTKEVSIPPASSSSTTHTPSTSNTSDAVVQLLHFVVNQKTSSIDFSQQHLNETEARSRHHFCIHRPHGNAVYIDISDIENLRTLSPEQLTRLVQQALPAHECELEYVTNLQGGPKNTSRCIKKIKIAHEELIAIVDFHNGNRYTHCFNTDGKPILFKDENGLSYSNIEDVDSVGNGTFIIAQTGEGEIRVFASDFVQVAKINLVRKAGVINEFIQGELVGSAKIVVKKTVVVTHTTTGKNNNYSPITQRGISSSYRVLNMDGSILVFKRTNGQLCENILHISETADGRYIAAQLHDDNKYHLFNPVDGTEIRTLETAEGLRGIREIPFNVSQLTPENMFPQITVQMEDDKYRVTDGKDIYCMLRFTPGQPPLHVDKVYKIDDTKVFINFKENVTALYRVVNKTQQAQTLTRYLQNFSKEKVLLLLAAKESLLTKDSIFECNADLLEKLCTAYAELPDTVKNVLTKSFGVCAELFESQTPDMTHKAPSPSASSGSSTHANAPTPSHSSTQKSTGATTTGLGDSPSEAKKPTNPGNISEGANQAQGNGKEPAKIDAPVPRAKQSPTTDLIPYTAPAKINTDQTIGSSPNPCPTQSIVTTERNESTYEQTSKTTGAGNAQEARASSMQSDTPIKILGEILAKQSITLEEILNNTDAHVVEVCLVLRLLKQLVEKEVENSNKNAFTALQKVTTSSNKLIRDCAEELLIALTQKHQAKISF